MLMAGAGLAEVLMPAECTADVIATAAKQALADPNRSTLDAVQDEIASMPSPTDVVMTLSNRVG